VEVGVRGCNDEGRRGAQTRVIEPIFSPARSRAKKRRRKVTQLSLVCRNSVESRGAERTHSHVNSDKTVSELWQQGSLLPRLLTGSARYSAVVEHSGKRRFATSIIIDMSGRYERT
jgi:hypothetical protein